MAKFGKFLLSTAALVGTAATAYYLYKHVKIDVVTEEDEDLDDFSEEETEAPRYVSLNTEASPVEKAAEAVAEKAAEVVEEAKEKAEDLVEAVAEKAEDVAEDIEESVEEFFNDDEN